MESDNIAPSAETVAVSNPLDRASSPIEPRNHLSPLSLLASTITGLRSIILPLAAVSFTLGSKLSPPILILIGLAIIAFSALTSYLAWRRFTYQICAEEIRIESGILSRNARSIPYERIQDVSIEQKLIARLLGITAVKFETGSSEGDEGALEFVSLDEAENLRQLIRARKSDVRSNHDIETADLAAANTNEKTQDDVIFAMDIERIFTLGIFNFSLVIFAIIAGAFQQFDFLLPGDIGDVVGYLFDSFDETSNSIKSIALTTQILAIMSVLIGIIVIGMLSGQLQTFLREYGFTLTATDRGIRRKRGLITLTDVVMPLHRVQAAIVKTGPIRKRFGWSALKFTSLGRDTGAESSHMIAPLAKDHEYWPIARLADIRPPSEDATFVHSDISYIAGSIVFGLIIAIIAISAAIIVEQTVVLPWIGLLGFIPILIGLLSWRHHFHSMDRDQIYVKSGFWNQKMTILPMIKIQSVDIVQGPLSQYLKLADVRFGIAGGSGLSVLTIQNIPIKMAQDLRGQCINRAKTVDFSALIRAPQ